MNDHMTIPEYVIAPELGISLDVAEKIRKYHAFPMNILRNKLRFPIIVSRNSGYRHPEYELSRNRTTSTHMFEEIKERQDPGFGAADYRVAPALWYKFATELVFSRIYTRLIFYPLLDTPFIHADYRFLGVDRFFYIMRGSQIQRVSKSEFLDAVWERFVKTGTNINI